MSEEKTGITKDLEELVNKTMEANKFFISEGSNILRHFTTNNTGDKRSAFMQPDALTNVFNAYMKLNIQHAKNLIDLGVGFIKQSVAPKDEPEAATAPVVSEPAFILSAEVVAGNKAILQFVLDNVKEETVVCTLVNTDYSLQTTTQPIQFNTSFRPQSFELKPGAAQTVKIEIDTAKESLPGTYTSHVQVRGFEPSFFSIQLTIKENQQQPKANGRKKTK